MRYLDLDVWIGPRAGQTYPVRAGTTSYGQAAEDAALELDALAPTLSAVVEERADPPTLTALGIRLHSLLFRAGTGRLATLLNQCLGGARGSGDGLRIRLRIEPPEVAALPWEFLYSTDDDCFIATSIHTPVVRYLELLQPIRELGVKPPLAMLVVIPQSEGIDAGAEEAVLAEALDHLGDAVVYKVITGDVTRARLREVLREREWQVLHYIGHGDFDGDRAVL
ncbi:MAG TPA: hypothetical protein VFM14_18625, partial [Gemmatimonadales bacterium]|nr:hypothetical protein [Gemmatimonadales bacterium]